LAYPESLEKEDLWEKTPLTIAQAGIFEDKDTVLEMMQNGPHYYAMKALRIKYEKYIKKQKETHEEQIAKMQQELAVLKNDCNDQREKNSGLEKQSKLEASKTLTLEAQLRVDSDRIAALIESEISLRTQLNEGRHKFSELQKIHSTEMTRLQLLVVQTQENETKLSALEKSERELKNELERKNKEIAEVKEKKKAIESSIQEILHKYKEMLAILDQEQAKQKEAIRLDKVKIESLEKSLHIAQNRIHTVLNHEGLLKSELDDLKARYSRLQSLHSLCNVNYDANKVSIFPEAPSCKNSSLWSGADDVLSVECVEESYIGIISKHLSITQLKEESEEQVLLTKGYIVELPAQDGKKSDTMKTGKNKINQVQNVIGEKKQSMLKKETKEPSVFVFDDDKENSRANEEFNLAMNKYSQFSKKDILNQV